MSTSDDCQICDSVRSMLKYIKFDCFAGFFLCLFWNVIAVTAAWIKGEGASQEFHFVSPVILFLRRMLIFYLSSRCENLVSGNYLLYRGCSRSLCFVVSTSISSHEVLFMYLNQSVNMESVTFN